ncbi:MAG: Xaa-Pro peptidase family protein [candidate division Zixibacteria bacterium]|nr:Xaa-Pro peptidase family protein [candidate division Zixibacteria bacterium]
MSAKRIGELRKKMRRENLDALIVSNLDHVRYLTGFTGSAALLLITGRKADMFTDSRYTEQADKQVSGAGVHTVKGDMLAALKDFPGFHAANSRYGFDSEHLSVAGRDRAKQALPKVLLVPAANVFAELGWVKDAIELKHIAHAAHIADLAFERVLGMVAPGVRERDLAAELEYQMKMFGSEDPAFETIIASGYRSALPHGVASAKKIKKGDLVTFDFGAKVNGYVSDITRTVVAGKATPRQKKIYSLVLKAQVAGIKKVRAGIEAKKVDAACRKIITKAGYGKNFGHGTGHGIGFFVHVGPRVGAASPDKLMVNNVITIEPGIYISGWGGVRIEDDVVVTRSGGRVLNKAPKNLLEL